MRARRPNFLLILTDQQRADHLGCAGAPGLPTPAIDGLARAGTRWTDCHVATPICQPNRASLLTGQLPSAHGVTMNGRELPLDAFSVAEALRQAGWRTGLVGKAHWQNITPVPPSWPTPAQRLAQQARDWGGPGHGQELATRWADPAHELRCPYYGFEQVQLSIGHGDQQSGHWRRWLLAQDPQAESLLGPHNAWPTPDWALPRIGQAWRTRLPVEWHPSTWVAEQGERLLQQWAQAADGAPFFLQCSFADPHHPFTPPGEHWSMLAPEDVVLPASFDAPLHRPPPPVQRLRQARRPEGFRPGYGSFAATEREVREAIALNHGNIALIDQAVGRLLAALDRLGLAEDTVVIFTSDHADLMGDRGLLFKGGLHYGALTRVPLIWRDPQASGGQVCEGLAQSTDVPVSMLARAGLPPVHGLHGRSLLAQLAQPQTALREGVLIEEESQRDDVGLGQRLRMRTWRTRTHRLTLWAGQPWGELVDLRNDPLELRNLWDEPSAQALRADMTEQLAQAMLAATDESPYPTQAA